MITRGFLFFVLAMSCSLFWGCTSYDLKDFNGCEHECVGPYFLAGTAAPLTSKPLTWKYRLAQNSDVPPGKFKFKFDIDPVQSGDILPQQFLFTFTHRSPKGKILLEEEFDVFTRDDGSIPCGCPDHRGGMERKEIAPPERGRPGWAGAPTGGSGGRVGLTGGPRRGYSP